MYYVKLSVLEALIEILREKKNLCSDTTVLHKTIFCYARICCFPADRKDWAS